MKSAKQINLLIAKWWRYLKTHRSSHWIIRMLNDSRYPDHHHQLTLTIFTVICVALFIFVFVSMITHTTLSALNIPLFALLRSLRNRTCDDIMIAFTMLGYNKTLIISAILIFAWLAWRRYWRAAWHWTAITFISAGTAEFFKHLYYSPRPQGILNQDIASSFPSGHMTLSVAMLGFLAVLIARELPPAKRRIPYIVVSIIVFFIGLSRLYLGAHWFTDVLAGLLLGLSCILVVTISYRRKPTPHIPSRAFTLISALMLLIVWTSYGVPHFHKYEVDYSLYWPSITLDKNVWWRHENHQIPLYVANRLGKPTQVLNVEWLGDLAAIKAVLNAQGWQIYPAKINLKGTLNQLSKQPNKTPQQHIPILPTLYHNQAPILLASKQINQQQEIILELWKSNITINNSNDNVWLGSIHYVQPKLKKHDQKKNIFNNVTATLIPYLTAFNWREVQVLPFEQPSLMLPLNWDGRLLLIKPKLNYEHK